VRRQILLFEVFTSFPSPDSVPDSLCSNPPGAESAKRRRVPTQIAFEKECLSCFVFVGSFRGAFPYSLRQPYLTYFKRSTVSRGTTSHFVR